MENIAKVSLTGQISNGDMGFGSMKLDKFDGGNTAPSFKDVMSGMVKDLDSTVKAPDQVMMSALKGNGADVHDVMIAISKAEIGINMATQITTKVVQAYEKIISIQV